MKTVILAFIFFSVVLGATLYFYLTDMIGFAIAGGAIIIIAVGAMVSSGEMLARHREADMRRKDKEDLPLYYKDKGDGP